MQRIVKGFTLLELMVVIAIISILSALAVPNFLGLEGRAKQAEAKSNLRALYDAERLYFTENDAFTTSVKLLGISIDRGNRYQYNLRTTSNLDDRTTQTVTVTALTDGIMVDTFRYGSAFGLGVSAATSVSSGVCTGGNISWGLTNLANGNAVFTAGAQANIDTDSTLDQWSISTESRALTGCNNSPPAINSPAGQPTNESNDVTN